MKRKIAVAGYTGFIGSYIMPKLKDYGYEIKEIKKDQLIQRDISKIVEAVNGCYAVINLSGYLLIEDGLKEIRT
jgi:nucleoside-diphosphate-sugar epimerase